jgi:hypothetical protein
VRNPSAYGRALADIGDVSKEYRNISPNRHDRAP